MMVQQHWGLPRRCRRFPPTQLPPMLGELGPHLELGVTWLLFSNPDICGSQPLTLPPPPPPCKQSSSLLSASFLHRPPPRHSPGRKEAPSPPPAALTRNGARVPHRCFGAREGVGKSVLCHHPIRGWKPACFLDGMASCYSQESGFFSFRQVCEHPQKCSASQAGCQPASHSCTPGPHRCQGNYSRQVFDQVPTLQ